MPYCGRAASTLFTITATGRLPMAPSVKVGRPVSRFTFAGSVEGASVGSAVLSAAEDSASAVGAAVAVASGSLAALSSVGFDPQPREHSQAEQQGAAQRKYSLFQFYQPPFVDFCYLV